MILKIKKILKNIISEEIYNKIASSKIIMKAFPIVKTKPYEFWFILSFLLIKFKPKNIIEFGSGRSTFTLAEFAYKKDINLISLEHNYQYYLLVKKLLKKNFILKNYVYYCPIKNDWYDINNINFSIPYDLIFIDGPNYRSLFFNNNSSRNSELAIKNINKIISSKTIVVIDDLHRKAEKKLAQKLKLPKDFIDLIYHNKSIIRLYPPNKSSYKIIHIFLKTFFKNISSNSYLID